jgi:hypothetical protein
LLDCSTCTTLHCTVVDYQAFSLPIGCVLKPCWPWLDDPRLVQGLANCHWPVCRLAIGQPLATIGQPWPVLFPHFISHRLLDSVHASMDTRHGPIKSIHFLRVSYLVFWFSRIVFILLSLVFSFLFFYSLSSLLFSLYSILSILFFSSSLLLFSLSFTSSYLIIYSRYLLVSRSACFVSARIDRIGISSSVSRFYSLLSSLVPLLSSSLVLRFSSRSSYPVSSSLSLAVVSFAVVAVTVAVRLAA